MDNLRRRFSSESEKPYNSVVLYICCPVSAYNYNNYVTIDTGIVPDETTDVEVTCLFTGPNSTQNTRRSYIISGGISIYHPNRSLASACSVYTVSPTFLRWANSGVTSSNILPLSSLFVLCIKVKLSHGGLIVKTCDVESTTYSQTSGSYSPATIKLFGASDTSNQREGMDRYIYNVKISKAGNVVMNLIPVRITLYDEEVGAMYDTISGDVFYYDQSASGKNLTYGPDVDKYTDSIYIQPSLVSSSYNPNAVFTLDPGTYKLECWGAQGGSSVENPSCKGGYSVGILTLTQDTPILAIAGTSGVYRTATGRGKGGYNGGGQCYVNNTIYPSGSGGGGSHISIGDESLYARVIVAGGGGGYYQESRAGGYGGGLSGGGFGGTQTGVGSSPYSNGTQPDFGHGGGYGDTGTWSMTGGGGGWYGGAHQQYNAGGGGSGYVYTSSTASNYPSGCLLNSAYYLENAQTIGGNQSFPSPFGGTETGHLGDGFIKITKLS